VTDELWALRPTATTVEVWTENGRHVATFMRREEAEEVVEDHNIEVEMNEPEPPEVVKTREEQIAARVQEWRAVDPSGARLLDLIITASARLQRLLSLRAPRIIIVQGIETICQRAEALKGLYPDQEAADFAQAEGRS
jgi:hypothetical protein